MMDSLLTMNKTTQSHLLDQHQLKIVGDRLSDRIEDLLDYFDIEYRQTEKMYIFSCPVHGGDNTTALNIYPHGDHYRGNWKCRTHQCEKIFMPSIIGFIRGVLSHRNKDWAKSGDSTVSFKDTLKFIETFLNSSLENIPKLKLDDKKKFANTIKKIQSKPGFSNNTITRDTIRKSLQIPAKYYIDRGYSTDILDKYDVGLCRSKGKPMYQRIVVPIYDDQHKYMIGCTGRSIFEKCENCGNYHNQANKCPQEYAWTYSKWKHNKGFKAEETLYNLWFAKEHIKNTKTVIIVESPGNVWKLEEHGIHNSVAIFGSNISYKQKLLLDMSGAMNIVILTDNDAAGEDAKKQIIKKFSQTYRIFCPKISKNDVAELSAKEIDDQIIKYIQREIYD